MTVTIRLFAIARQRAGAPEVAVELPEAATVADLRRAVAEQHPALGHLLPALMVAVANEYAEDDRVIGPGEEVALIPPVSGGEGRGARVQEGEERPGSREQRTKNRK